MKTSFSPKHFLIGLVVCMLAGLIFAMLFHVSFWLGVVIAAVGMFLNGLIAEWEDRQPGGFLNPTKEPKDRGPSAS